MALTFWHCQYILNVERQKVAERLGCHVAPIRENPDGEGRNVEQFAVQPKLTAEQVQEIGSTSVCWFWGWWQPLAPHRGDANISSLLGLSVEGAGSC